MKKILFILMILLSSEMVFGQTTVTYTSSGTFYVPYGVTSITVECYGAGGGGGGDGIDNSVGSSGGGGGAYARSVISVTAGASFPYTIGAAGSAGSGAAGGNGGNTTFNTTTVVAEGGKGGGANGAAGGAGGLASNSTGDVKYDGGSGATSSDVNGRGGGGTGGSSSNGNTGGNQVGATAVTGGYAGGAGGTGDGAAGNAPSAGQYGGGGGGSGDRSGASENGGAGLAGVIKITYTGVATTYRIGASGDDFTSITSARSSIETAGVDAPIIIELQSDYAEGSETYPITFASVPGISTTNTVTYRPASGVTGLVTGGAPASATALISFSGADYIILDGRAAGVGTTVSDIQWTIRNERTSATIGSTIDISSDAVYNTFKFLNIEGEASTYGIIYFKTASSGGNDNNTISYCKIQDRTDGSGTTAFPDYGIRSSGTTGQENSGNTVDNCHFIDVYYADAATGGVIQLSTANDAWTITNNHFYQNSATTLPALSYGWAFIQTFTGGGYTITGNYIGGAAASCGGTAYTVSGTSFIYAIYIDDACTGSAITINSNVIQNISITSTSVSSYFSGIYVAGTTANIICGDATVGASTGNTIGSMTATGSILLTHNSGSGTTGFRAIYLDATGTNKVDYNKIGGITEAGSLTGTISYCILTVTGTNTLKYNKIGGDGITNSINISVGNDFRGIYNSATNGLDVQNCTIQNVIQAGTTVTFYGIYNAVGTLTCSSNTITAITTSTNTSSYMIRNYNATPLTTAATVSSNTINTITFTGTTSDFWGIAIETSGTIICNSNTIGSTTNNNISLAGDDSQRGIYFAASSTSITCNSNTVQEFNLTNTGTSTIFYGIHVSSGVFSGSSNTIQNNDNAGTLGGTIMIGIYCPSSSAGQSILSNTVTDLNATTTGAYSTYVRGIWCTTGSGNVKKNIVKNLVNKATTTPFTYGITLTSGSWNVHNNVVLLSNGGNDNNVSLNGIQDDSPTTNTMTIHHNTVKISGSTTAAAITRAFRRTGAASTTVYNNIFQNVRTGTGTHYAYTATDVTTLTTDENYLEVTDDANYLGYWSATAYNFTNWKTAFVGEDNSLNGTETVNSTTGKASTTFVGANAGTDLFTGSTVTDDNEGTARDIAPWMGAFEGGVVLPIELTSFTGSKEGKNNELFWVTATELNNDYFTLEKTYDGEAFEIVGTLDGAGNSTQYLYYSFIDYDVREVLNYYRLKQTDFDGKFAYSSIITIDNRANVSSKEVVMITNILGQEVNEHYRGVVIVLYSDGTSIKVIQ